MSVQTKLREAQEALRKAAEGETQGDQSLMRQFLAQADQLRTAVLQAAVDQQRVWSLPHHIDSQAPKSYNGRHHTVSVCAHDLLAAGSSLFYVWWSLLWPVSGEHALLQLGPTISAECQLPNFPTSKMTISQTMRW